jgi:hypothetical protein
MTPPLSYVDEVRRAADNIRTAPDLLRWFMDRLGPDFSDAYFVFTFVPAFGVPLTTIHVAHDWIGFGRGGHLSDEDLDGLLSPWIWPGRQD